MKSSFSGALERMKSQEDKRRPSPAFLFLHLRACVPAIHVRYRSGLHITEEVIMSNLIEPKFGDWPGLGNKAFIS